MSSVPTAALLGADLSVLGSSAVAIAAMMLVVWLISLVMRDASIVDLAWGLGFVIVAVVVRVTVDGPGLETRRNLLTILPVVWGLRLFAYLAWRNLGHGEDFRYQRMRRHWGPRFPLISLVTVFGLQGVLMWVVSLPIQLGQASDATRGLGLLAIIGTLLWIVGMFFESVGDLQLARFKANPANDGRIMDRGLWAWTRHPNYFGDFCVWWGIGLVALETGVPGIIAIVGPVVMSVLLLRVSGKALLERNLRKRRPGYDDYVARTSGFFPRPPKRAAGAIR